MSISTASLSAYSQIPFEFTEGETAEQQAALSGVRIKSVRKKEPAPEKPLPPLSGSGRGRRSLRNHITASEEPKVPADEILFSKQYYSMGEVALMFQVNHSLLRFWEAEFDILQPRKNKKGDRHFRPEDIKNLQLIYDLLRRRKLTIEGARNFLKQQKNARERFELILSLQQLKSFLLELKASL